MAKNIPVGVKVIAVLHYIGAVLFILGGLAFLIAGPAAMGAFASSLGGFAALFGGLAIVVGILFIAFAVLCFFIARGLWKGQKWARIIVIIFAILGILSALTSIIQGQFTSIIGLIIDAVIGGYMLFSKSVKAAFA